MRKKDLFMSKEEIQEISDSTKPIFNESGILIGLECNRNYTNVYYINEEKEYERNFLSY